MTLSKVKKYRTGCVILGVTFWIVFVYYSALGLKFPSNVLYSLLGLISPFFWYKILIMNHKFLERDEDNSTDGPATLKRTALLKALYLAFGAASWGIFVYWMSPRPCPPIGLFFHPDPVLYRVLGLLIPFLLWPTACLMNDNNSVWRYIRGTDSPTYQRDHQPSKVRNIMGWALLIFSWWLWTEFSDYVTYGFVGSWVVFLVDWTHMSPFFLLFALYLSIHYERESRSGSFIEEAIYD